MNWNIMMRYFHFKKNKKNISHVANKWWFDRVHLFIPTMQLWIGITMLNNDNDDACMWVDKCGNDNYVEYTKINIHILCNLILF